MSATTNTEPKRCVSTFTWENGNRTWTVMSGGTPETGPGCNAAQALAAFRRFDKTNVPDGEVPIWDGDNGVFTTWEAYHGE